MENNSKVYNLTSVAIMLAGVLVSMVLELMSGFNNNSIFPLLIITESIGLAIASTIMVPKFYELLLNHPVELYCISGIVSACIVLVYGFCHINMILIIPIVWMAFCFADNWYKRGNRKMLYGSYRVGLCCFGLSLLVFELFR